MLNERHLFLLEPKAGFIELDLAATAIKPAPPDDADTGIQPMRTALRWEPAVTQRLRRVEDLVLLGLVGYFACGLAAVFGVF